MELLRSLRPEDWQRPTACRDWSVQDIAAHMLDTQIRLLSRGRDGAPGSAGRAITDYSSLVGFINDLNAEWITAARRMSPRVLMDILTIIGPQLCDHLRSLDPDAPALFSVAWAGEDVSANWFDIGRSYTEYWHHQQQIRDAVGAPGLTERELMHPVLAIFMRALPHTYREVTAAEGVTVTVSITGDAGGTWSLMKNADGWRLEEGGSSGALSRVTLSDDTAWRLFTKGLSFETAGTRVAIEGDRTRGEPFLRTLAVMG